MAKFILQPDRDEQIELDTSGIKEFYLSDYPEDELGIELSDATFADILDALNNGVDVYDIMGYGDSVIRERIFERLADILDVDYDVIYDLWIKG